MRKGYKRLKLHHTLIYSCHSFGHLYKLVLRHEEDLMLTLKQTDVRLEYKARVDLLCLILGQTLTGS